ncbi:MAG: hypothetical protein RI988_116, partial [Pseudomonadota bacterium]
MAAPRVLALVVLGSLALGAGAQLTTPPVVPPGQTGSTGSTPADLTVPVIRPASPGTGALPTATTPGTPEAAEAARQARATPVKEGREELPPNEFQKFVFATTGQVLPVFGANFFSEASALSVQMDRLPVPADYLIGPGDELHVRAWGSIDMDIKVLVDRNGQISLPRVGTLSIARRSISDAERIVREQMSRTFKGFSLSVGLGQLRSLQIFVVGQARKPGAYSLGALTTMVGAVFASGGPGPNGSMRRVQLR